MRGAAGFTLVELMLVVALIGILAMLAGPNMMRVLRSGQLSAEGRIFYGAFMETQGLALDTGNVATLKLIRTGADRGWEVRADRNGDGSDELISRHRFDDSRPAIGFGPATGFPDAFEVPYTSVDRDSWCTVCGADEGSIEFDSDGTLVGGSSGSVVLQDTSGSLPTAAQALVFIGATGAAHLERKD